MIPKLSEALHRFHSMSEKELRQYCNKWSNRLPDFVVEYPEGYMTQVISVMRSEHMTDKEYFDYKSNLRNGLP